MDKQIVDLDWGWKAETPNVDYDITISYPSSLTTEPEGKEIEVFTRDDSFERIYFVSCFDWNDFLTYLNVQYPRPKPWTKGLAKKHFNFRDKGKVESYKFNGGVIVDYGLE